MQTTTHHHHHNREVQPTMGTYEYAMQLLSRNVDTGTIAHFLEIEAGK